MCFNRALLSGTKKKYGPWFSIKMPSCQYSKFHCGDKTILRPSYLHNGISYTGKMTFLYWTRALALIYCNAYIRKGISKRYISGGGFLFSMRKDFIHLYHFSVEKWYKMHLFSVCIHLYIQDWYTTVSYSEGVGRYYKTIPWITSYILLTLLPYTVAVYNIFVLYAISWYCDAASISNPFWWADMDRCIPHRQCHGCWWPGIASRQGINSYDIDLPVVISEYFRLTR